MIFPEDHWGYGIAVFISLSPGILYLGIRGFTVRTVVIPFFKLDD